MIFICFPRQRWNQTEMNLKQGETNSKFQFVEILSRDNTCAWLDRVWGHCLKLVKMNFYQNFYQNYPPKNVAFFYANQNQIDSSNSKPKPKSIDETKSTSTKSDTGYASAESSIESDDEKELNHILEPQNTNCSPNGPRKCLAWACKACKKKTVAIDRRKAATLRERRRLRKVKNQTLVAV